MEKIIHQIWVGPYQMPEREMKFSMEIRDKLYKYYPDFKYILWTDNNLPHLPDNLKILWRIFGERKDYAFQADILRIYLIYEFGGLYLDIDHEWVHGPRVEDFSYEGIFLNHGEPDHTIPNQSFGGSRHSPVMTFLFNSISQVNEWYGPSWLGDTVREYYGHKRSTDHSIIYAKLHNDRVLYDDYNAFQDYFRHIPLYSWSQENKQMFADIDRHEQTGGPYIQTQQFLGRTIEFISPCNNHDAAINAGIITASEISPHLNGLEKPILIDIGANSGSTSISLCLEHPDLMAYAFEPHPRIFPTLLQNIEKHRLQDRVKAFNIAVYSHDKELVIPDEPIENWHNNSGWYRAEERKWSNPAAVQAKSLNQIVDELSLDHIDVLKCDCEGAEFFIFSTFTYWDRVHKIHIEVHGLPDYEIEKLEEIGMPCSTGGLMKFLRGRMNVDEDSEDRRFIRLRR